MAEPADVDADARGILWPAARPWRMERIDPGSRLGAYVQHLWHVEWDLRGREPFEQPVLAHVAVNIVLEPQRAGVYGVPTTLRAQTLRGSGWALGVMFRPGGFRAFWSGPVSGLTDRFAPVDTLGGDAEQVLDRVRGADPETRAELVVAWLESLAPDQPPDATLEAVATAELAAADRTLVRADQLAVRVGRDLRSLQRLFAEHVGLSPKQVLRRYRLLEAAERAARDEHVSWDELALDLGFSDQSHLVRDFTAAFGTPPGRYAAECRARRHDPSGRWGVGAAG